MLMPLIPKQTDVLINEIAMTENLLVDNLLTNPFFVEWFLCSDLNGMVTPVEMMSTPPLVSKIFNNSRYQLLDYTRQCPIIQYTVSQYKLMKSEFRSIEKEFSEPYKIIENCFQVSNLYWEILKTYLAQNSFDLLEHEIYFFKTIKPAFISECDFLSLAYHALLFKKATDKDENFWDREKTRKEKFQHEHADFFSCYLKGCTSQDHLWFTRSKDFEKSSHDHLVTTWFALKRYDAFIDSAILQ
jgi:hypothetical protein